MESKRVLSVGQCWADHQSIARVLATQFGAEIVPAATAAEAVAMLRRQSFDLVLVNRVLDQDGSAGLGLIGQLKGDMALLEAPVLMVSNYEESQQAAMAQGAVRGFGKASLGSPLMVAALRPYLGQTRGKPASTA